MRVAITEAGRALETEMREQVWARLGRAFGPLSERVRLESASTQPRRTSLASIP